jgi:hypothetical protein
MSDALLVAIAALVFVGLPTAILGWGAILQRREADEPQEPGDQSHHPDSLRNVFRINGRRDDA